jgi:glycine cleavage system H protein
VYTEEHLWARVLGTEATIGITDHAQHELGDVVFVELPSPGVAVFRGKTFGVVESVKVVSDLRSPLTGTVLRVNDALAAQPEIVNQDPYGSAWMLVVQITSPGEVAAMMTGEAYQAFINELR